MRTSQHGLPESDVRTALPEVQHTGPLIDQTHAMEQYATLQAIIQSALAQPFTDEPESMDVGPEDGPSLSAEETSEQLASDVGRRLHRRRCC